jgi:FSR family fosmidomycin resistance protein-like MFS transporter
LGKKNSFQTGNVILVSFAHLVHDTFTAFLAPILPILTSALGMSYSMAAFLSVVQRIPSLLNPFIGLIADKVSVRYFIILTPLLSSILMSLLGLAPSYLILVVMLFFVGISSVLFHVPAPAMIKRLSGDKVGRGMSYYMLGGELARTLGPLTILGAISPPFCHFSLQAKANHSGLEVSH